MKLPFVNAPKSLCIMRLSAVGDVCHTLSVVRSIQHQWPETQLTWIIGKLEATLVGDIPEIEFIVFDKSKGLKAYQELRSKLQSRQFDALLHMQVSLRSSLATKFVKTNIRVGYDKQRAKDYQWLFTNHKINAVKNQHVLDSLFEFAKHIGIKNQQLTWDIPIPTNDLQFVKSYTEKLTPFAIISPCSSARFRNWRNWSAEGYAEICNFLKKEYDLNTILTGGPSEIECNYAQTISNLAKQKPVDLIGKTNLKQLLALLSEAKFVITPDSGPAHMATTVSTPVIGLYVTSNPERTGPYLSQQWVINKYPTAIKDEFGRDSNDVSWGKRVRSPKAMELISVDDVKSKIGEFMKTSGNN